VDRRIRGEQSRRSARAEGRIARIRRVSLASLPKILYQNPRSPSTANARVTTLRAPARSICSCPTPGAELPAADGRFAGDVVEKNPSVFGMALARCAGEARAADSIMVHGATRRRVRARQPLNSRVARSSVSRVRGPGAGAGRSTRYPRPVRGHVTPPQSPVASVPSAVATFQTFAHHAGVRHSPAETQARRRVQPVVRKSPGPRIRAAETGGDVEPLMTTFSRTQLDRKHSCPFRACAR